MNIKTKYNIDDEVYLISNSDIKIGNIDAINISIDYDKNITIFYDINAQGFFMHNIDESQLFSNTKEIYKHIEKQLKELK